MRFASPSGRARRPTRPVLAVCVALLLTVVACSNKNKPAASVAYSGDPKPPAAAKRIPDVLGNDAGKRFTKLLALVDAAGLKDALSGTGPITLFAPTDSAFATSNLSSDLLDPKKVEKSESLKKDLAAVLKSHVVAKEVTFTQPAAKKDESDADRSARLTKVGIVFVKSQEAVTNLPGDSLLVNATTKTVKRSGSSVEAKIINPDVLAPNGYIQVIDTVLASAK